MLWDVRRSLGSFGKDTDVFDALKWDKGLSRCLDMCHVSQSSKITQTQPCSIGLPNATDKVDRL